MAGVIGHIYNPTIDQSVELARVAESAGASWVGLADAFWWRDTWMQLAAVAAATSTIEIGPAMTNPYLRHPFHTVSALATLQELAPGRTFVGVTAGGSEVSGAAGISRADAPERVDGLVGLIRAVAKGEPLDAGSGRSLELPLEDAPILVAARGDAMLRTAGRVADRVLLWATPDSDLERCISLIREGAADRAQPPELIWAPIVAHDESVRESLMHVAVYACLNTRASIRRAWGLADALAVRIRETLVGGGTEAASALVPEAALHDLVLVDPSPDAVARRARELGVSSMAVPGYTAESTGRHTAWALEVESFMDQRA